MRVQVVDPQKNIKCGICGEQGDWIKRVDVSGIKGLYCVKCDTLTIYEPLKTKYVYKAFKNECQKIKDLYHTNVKEDK